MGAGRVNYLFGHVDSLLGSDLGSSRLVSCSTVPQNLTSGRRLTPKSLIVEASGSRRLPSHLLHLRSGQNHCHTKIRRSAVRSLSLAGADRCRTTSCWRRNANSVSRAACDLNTPASNPPSSFKRSFIPKRG